MSYINLTRKILPALSSSKAENIRAIKSMPESILTSAINSGDKSIVHVGMNQCAAVRTTPEGITTVFTDGLAGCNSIAFVSKGLDGFPVIISSHYTPLKTSQEKQISAIQKQLDTFWTWLDKSVKPKVFLNLRDNEPNNPIIKSYRELLKKYFPNGVNEKIEYYKNSDRAPFFSSANIFQFDPKDMNKFKVTFVGEVEHFDSLV
ncbi:hypothetical protein HDR58_04520 [bacterium]|nr:hypothetical protein [bacterium]